MDQRSVGGVGLSPFELHGSCQAGFPCSGRRGGGCFLGFLEQDKKKLDSSLFCCGNPGVVSHRH